MSAGRFSFCPYLGISLCGFPVGQTSWKQRGPAFSGAESFQATPSFPRSHLPPKEKTKGGKNKEKHKRNTGCAFSFAFSFCISGPPPSPPEKESGAFSVAFSFCISGWDLFGGLPTAAGGQTLPRHASGRHHRALARCLSRACFAGGASGVSFGGYLFVTCVLWLFCC